MRLADYINESLDSFYDWWNDSENAPAHMYAQYAFEVDGTVYAVRFLKVPKYKESSDVLIGRRANKKISPKLGPIKNIKKFVATVVAIVYAHGVEEAGKGTRAFRLSFLPENLDRLEGIMDFAVQMKLKTKYEGARFDKGPKEGMSYYYIWKKGQDLSKLFSFYFEQDGKVVKQDSPDKPDDLHTDLKDPLADEPTQDKEIEPEDEVLIPMGTTLWEKSEDDVLVVLQNSPGEFLAWPQDPSDNNLLGWSGTEPEQLDSDQIQQWLVGRKQSTESFYWAIKKDTGKPTFSTKDVVANSKSTFITLQPAGDFTEMNIEPDGLLTIIGYCSLFITRKHPGNQAFKKQTGSWHAVVLNASTQTWLAVGTETVFPFMEPHVNIYLPSTAFNSDYDPSILNMTDEGIWKDFLDLKSDKEQLQQTADQSASDDTADVSADSLSRAPAVDFAFDRPPKDEKSRITRNDILKNAGENIENIIDNANGKVSIEIPGTPISFNSGMSTTEIMDNMERLEEMVKNDSSIKQTVKNSILSHGGQTKAYFKALTESVNEKKPLNTEYTHAIRSYTGASFTRINKVLRGEKEPQGSTLTLIQNIDSAFQESGFYLPDNTVIYRGSSLSNGEISAIANGEQHKFSNYTSCSFNPGVATSFASSEGTQKWLSKKAGVYTGSRSEAQGVIFSIDGLSNVPVLVPGNASSYPVEQEVMIPRETVVELAPGSRVEQVGSQMVAFHTTAKGVRNPDTGMVESLNAGGLSFQPTFQKFLENKQDDNERVNSIMIMAGLVDIVGADNLLTQEQKDWLEQDEP